MFNQDSRLYHAELFDNEDAILEAVAAGLKRRAGAVVKAIKELPLLASKKNPMVRRHQQTNKPFHYPRVGVRTTPSIQAVAPKKMPIQGSDDDEDRDIERFKRIHAFASGKEGRAIHSRSQYSSETHYTHGRLGEAVDSAMPGHDINWRGDSGKFFHNVWRDMMYQWNSSSSGANAKSVAMQMAIRDEFDLGDAARTPSDQQVVAEASDVYKQIGEAYRKILRIIYDHTQEELAQEGIKEATLYRGMDLPTNLPMKQWVSVSVKSQPASSFSADKDRATDFGNVVLAMTVPAHKVLMRNRDAEEEWVVLSASGHAVARKHSTEPVGMREAGFV